MMKPEPAPIVSSRRLPKRRRNSRPSGVSRSSGGSSPSTSPPETVSVTAMFTTAGSTRLTSGEKLSGAERGDGIAGCGRRAGRSKQRKGQDQAPWMPGWGHIGGFFPEGMQSCVQQQMAWSRPSNKNPAQRDVP